MKNREALTGFPVVILRILDVTAYSDTDTFQRCQFLSCNIYFQLSLPRYTSSLMRIIE